MRPRETRSSPEPQLRSPAKFVPQPEPGAHHSRADRHHASEGQRASAVRGEAHHARQEGPRGGCRGRRDGRGRREEGPTPGGCTTADRRWPTSAPTHGTAIWNKKEELVEDPKNTSTKKSADTVLKKLFRELGPRYADRPGGYTRVMKQHYRRLGDAGATAVIELLKAGEESPDEGEATGGTHRSGTRPGGRGSRHHRDAARYRPDLANHRGFHNTHWS